MSTEKRPSFGAALFVILFLCFAMFAQIFIIGEDWITHITLIVVAAVAAIVAMASGFTYDDVQKGVLYGCEIAMLPMLILMMVGVLVGSWIPAGTIPTLIYYGLSFISPSVFLLTVAIVCVVASVSTGSSWTTGATFGVAFMGIGHGLGIPPAMTAGAVISGAIFGDKMSPLSDATNLAAGVAEADLFDHIKSMFYTTGPAILISFVLYAFLGMRFAGGELDTGQIDIILAGLRENYLISPITLIPPIIVVILAVKRVSGLAVMIIASIVGGLFAIFFQGYSVGDVANFMNYGYTSSTGIADVDALLSRGGLQSMMWTISLGFIALSMGGILEKTKVLEVLLEKISGLVSTAKGLITTHVISAIAVNLFSASQYMAILIPSRMFVPAYKKQRILPQVNSRTAEDAGTVTSPLVPWGLCGVFFTGALGVPTMEYFPYVYLSFVTPIIAVIYGFTGMFIFKEGDIKSVKTYNDDAEEAKA
ncbi:transporter, NhaC family (TC 2.A.35) [Natronincola peptidivorans]|uniref:Transporter, NhaC family (TC 2.A.35) n=1 Tax=Natronincola peptidivorans TaxID=426128 RepID=A0A1H9ZM56_9FIRM|nr:Na+/H+ antiporter NhaC [Natronincola peptidivorans]SES82807.1 transporter, NhaC family (TC 2.A.35) [Natronincola peptidivorans]